MPLTLLAYSAAAMLKQLTAEKHQQLEALMLPCLTSITQKHQYVQLLHSFYGYFKPVEDDDLKDLDPFNDPGFDEDEEDDDSENRSSGRRRNKR